MSEQRDGLSGDVERLTEACCEHSLYWHHDERGCGYHGYAPEHRCPCLLTFDEALAAHDAEVAARALREAAEVVESFRSQNPMNGDGSNYTIERILTALVGADEEKRLKHEHRERWNAEYVAFHAKYNSPEARADRVAGHTPQERA